MDAPSSSSDRDPLERLAAEFVDRRRRGEVVSPSEYADRYPEWAEQIREFFPALDVMEGLKPGFGDHTASVDGRCEAAAPPTLEQLGEYRILREIGHGGMGVVYEAIQESLGRRVALKILPFHGRIDPVQIERFRLESRSAARLHHGNIVPVHGVGEHEGVYYYAMQYIQGHGLDVILDDLRRLRAGAAMLPSAPGDQRRDDTGSLAVARSLLTGWFGGSQPVPDSPKATNTLPGGGSERHGAPVPPLTPIPVSQEDRSSLSSVLSHTTDVGYYRTVARLGVQVAEALAHAHGQGVLHRDIKPSNLLLDAAGHVWVTDFGLAKLEGADGPTRTGDIVGTLRYMAPERFDGWSDRRSDLYGLGMTLYELLTLRPAFDAPTRARLIEQVVHDAPPAPRKHDPRVPRDLETIVLKAIAKEPGERYATAEALASDLNNYLADRPIVARRSSLSERAWRWCRRNKAAAGLLAASAVAALALVGVVVGIIYNTRLEAANYELRVTQQAEESLKYFNHMVLAEREWHGNNPARSEQILDGIPIQYRGWEWSLLKRVSHSESQDISGFTNQVFGVAFSPDPKAQRIATASVRDGVMVWDAGTRQLVSKPTGLDGSVVSVAFSLNGKRLAAGVFKFERPGAIWIGSAETGRVERMIPAHVGLISCVAFSHDGKYLASAAEDGTVIIWDTNTGAMIETLGKDQTRGFTSVAFSPDGRYLAAATGTRKEQALENPPGEVRIWETSTWGKAHVLAKHTRSVNSIAYSPDGRWLASAGSDRTVKIWDTQTGVEVATLLGHTHFVVGVAFSPDGKRLVSASEDSTLRVWDTETQETVRILQGHSGKVNGVAYSPDGKRIASSSDDRTVKVWAAEQPPVARVLGGAGRKWFTDVAYSPDGKYLAGANGDRTVTIWDRANYEVQMVLRKHDDPIWGVAFGPNDLIASACGDVFRAEQSSELRIWNWKDDQLVRSLPMRVNVVWSVAFSPDGRLMATGGGDFQGGDSQKVPVELTLWDTRTWTVHHPLPGHSQGVACVTFSRDGEFLASAANEEGLVKVWEVRTGRCILTLNELKLVTGVAFSPDGQSLVTADSQSATIWSLATRQPLQVLRGHLGQVKKAAYHPGGERLATAGEDGSVRIWDVNTGQEVLTLRGHKEPVEDVTFSPNGQELASASRDGTVRIWDGAPWVEPAPRSAQASGVNATRR
jgi:WD40 repeat protein/serine/threonine protein kinase